MSETIHDLADKYLPGPYTVERREFQDGDSRTLAVHNYGWSSTNYVTMKLWKESRDIWVEYHEHDVRRTRDIHQFELGERVV